jgi:glycerol kinase
MPRARPRCSGAPERAQRQIGTVAREDVDAERGEAPDVRLVVDGLGAAYLAGLGVGVWRSLDAVAKRHAVDRTFTPAMPAPERAQRYEDWKRAVERSRDWTRSG